MTPLCTGTVLVSNFLDCIIVSLRIQKSSILDDVELSMTELSRSETEPSHQQYHTGPTVLRTADISKINIKSSFEAMKSLCPFLKRSRSKELKKNMKSTTTIF